MLNGIPNTLKRCLEIMFYLVSEDINDFRQVVRYSIKFILSSWKLYLTTHRKVKYTGFKDVTAWYWKRGWSMLSFEQIIKPC